MNRDEPQSVTSRVFASDPFPGDGDELRARKRGDQSAPSASPPPPGDAGATAEPTSGGKAKPSQATLLVELAQECELWHDPDGVGYATAPVGDHVEHHPVRTRPYRTWLRRAFYRAHGKAPGSQGVQDAVEILDAQACFDGAEHPAPVRVAEHAGAIYLDLADTDWRAVEITAAGWKVIGPADAPVRFRRRRGMHALPVPEHGGRLGELREFVNVTDDSWPLLAAFLAAAVRPTGPYPVLNVLGEHGTGKSTMSKVIRRLFDPNGADVRRLTRDERDLVLAATNGAVVVYENVSGLQPWQSDALAALATGTGFATRTLYENDEETIFSACRPIVLNGIANLASRADLLDRSIIVELARIDEDHRCAEGVFWPAYYAARPRLLGALLDAVACGLDRLADTTLDRLPRMADFAQWAVACEPALDVPPGAFLAAYTRNRATAQAVAMEESPVAQAVCDFVADAGEWTGTAGELHQALTTEDRKRSKTWPASGQALAPALKSDAPALRAAGLDVIYDESHRDARGRRLWTFTRLGSGESAESAGVPDPGADLRKRPGSPPGTLRQSGSPAGSPGTIPLESAGPETPSDQASGSPGSPGSPVPTQSSPPPGNADADPAAVARLRATARLNLRAAGQDEDAARSTRDWHPR